MKTNGRKNQGTNGRTKSGGAREPIAIIGIGCRFPGHVNGPGTFWQMLCNGVDAITEIPPDRWSIRSFYDPETGTPGKTYARWGGFLEDIDMFDAGFFGISPREAALMDPQQRLLLEAAYEAFEDGGQALENIAGSNTAVYIGVSTADYQLIQSAHDDQEAVELHSTTGSVMSIVANRISYCFDLKGPSVALDTACSSSLVAVHLACTSIWNHESDLALAGGVNVIIAPQAYIGYCKLSVLSHDGRCKAFDASGDGFVRSEGVGVILLKPLSMALRDGDNIYAAIRGTAVNQDGRTNGITVPSQESQAAMVREACSVAGIAPGRVQYVEAHGTGTSVGDPIEAEALGSVLSRTRPAGRPCVIGSVKTNIGHCEAGAGIAGLIKTALCIRHRQIPPSLHFKTPNPLIDFKKLNLTVRTTLGPWPDDSAPLLAGVNSFGFGGANAHALLSDVPPAGESVVRTTLHPARIACLIPFSAQSADALKTLAQRYAGFIRGMKNGSDISLEELGGNLALRRSHHSHRMSIVARTKEELVQNLEAHLHGEARPGMRTAVVSSHSKPGLAFVFSGQGQQWWAMGRQLLEQEPVFLEALKECDALLAHHASWSLLNELTAAENVSRLHETAIAQPAIFALQVGLTALWKSWGVEPDAVIGHSVGEVAAAHTAGILSLEDAVRVIVHRGRTMDLASSRGRMLGVGMSPQEAADVMRGFEDRVSVAAINSPSSVTLSGDPEALDTLARILEEKQIFHSFLKVNYAFHSPQMDPVRDELLNVLQGITPKTARRKFFSTVLSTFVEGTELDGHYWWHNVRDTVRFGPGIEHLIDDGNTFFVELSAHPVLSAYVNECLKGKETHGVIVPSLRRNEEEGFVMLNSLGGLHTSGYPVDWKRQYPRRLVQGELPRYPWAHESYWHECETMRAWRLGSPAHPLLGERLKTANPSWSVQVSCASFPYLADHRVQGHAVFPAAAYCEVALAAAREVLGGGTYILEEVDFLKAMFVPISGEAPTLQTSFYPEYSTFTVHSRMHSGQPWQLHASGKIRSEQPASGKRPVDLGQLQERFTESISREACYQAFDDRGLQFGPSFRGIETMLRKDGESLAAIQLPAHLQAGASEYIIHPAALDASLQALSGAFAKDALRSDLAVMLPVHVAQLKCCGRPSNRIWSHTRLLHQGPQSLEGDITLLDQEGNILIEIRGLKGQSVDTMQGTSPEAVDDLIYEVLWQLKPRMQSSASGLQNDEMPGMAEMERRLRAESLRFADLAGWKQKQIAVVPAINQLCSSYIMSAFKTLGWVPVPGEKVAPESLGARLGVIPRYHRLLRRYLDILAEDGTLVKLEGEWKVGSVPDAPDPAATWRSILHEFPAFYAELLLTASCGSHLTEVLQGKTDPLDLIFPDGSQVISEHLFQDSPSFKVDNMVAARAVSMALEGLPEGRKVRLLEIGGGTAGMTSYVLPGLPTDGMEYVFTDISPHFLRGAEQRFHDAGFMKYQTLDIEKDPETQGFAPHAYDVILASDVLHATNDLRSVLGNVQRLLASDGLFVLLEIDRPARWLDLVFGLTEGWWRCTDHELRPAYPLLSRSAWTHLLRETGFKDPIAISERNGPQEPSQAVFVSRGPTLAPQPTEKADLRPERTPGHWLLFADSGGTGTAIAERLGRRGDSCILLSRATGYKQVNDLQFQINPAEREDFQRLLRDLVRVCPSLHGVIHCWSLDASPPEKTTLVSLEDAATVGVHSVTNLIQAWAETGTYPRFDLWLVTGGAQPVGAGPGRLSVAQAPLIGLARVIANEHPDLHCKLVDLSRTPTPAEIDSLVEELFNTGNEDEIAIRGQGRYAPALARSSVIRSSTQGKKVVNPSTFPVRVAIDTPGLLDNLELQESVRRKPGPGEIEIHVHAASLNFRDVLKALGIYPTDSVERLQLGDECAGVVTDVGEGVTGFKTGDEVLASARGSLSSYITTDSIPIVRKPSHLSFEEAATIPIAFITAYYALHVLGRIAEGERVFVQAGAGGVGMAAIQIAQLAGAEVFATAGSTEKRELLKCLGVKHVMNSRSLAFAEEIMEMTHGRGVDIVLNSLAGDAIQQGLSCLAPSGRFIELGTKDIFQNTRLGLRAFKNGISFLTVGPATLSEKPLFVRSGLETLVRLFEDRRLHPLPHRVFPLREVRNAFRYMAQAKHIGRVVLSFQDDTVAVEPRVQEAHRCREDATYLITGGLGGFGLATAEWLAANGARHLVLVGRSGEITGNAAAAITGMEARGVQVVVSRADVTIDADVLRVINDIQTSLPPLRGVIHSAMVLDDGILLQLTADRFRHVMRPKTFGAWNLHNATKHLPLDFFLLYSSVATMAGNPGQGSYVAANVFLEALSHYRHELGLPSLAIAWGHVNDVGYVARNAQVGAHLDSIGLKGYSAKLALGALGRVMGSSQAQVGIMKVDWHEWFQYAPAHGSSRFSLLIDPELANAEASRGQARIRDAIIAAQPEGRAELVRAFLTEQVARVVGMSPSKMDPERPINEMGLDSLMMMELKNRIEKDTGASLPTVELMRGPNIIRLTQILLAQTPGLDATGGKPVEPAIRPIAPIVPLQQPAAELLAGIDKLPDEAVEALLKTLDHEGELKSMVIEKARK